jgi:hypothetical protein
MSRALPFHVVVGFLNLPRASNMTPQLHVQGAFAFGQRYTLAQALMSLESGVFKVNHTEMLTSRHAACTQYHYAADSHSSGLASTTMPDFSL